MKGDTVVAVKPRHGKEDAQLFIWVEDADVTRPAMASPRREHLPRVKVVVVGAGSYLCKVNHLAPADKRCPTIEAMNSQDHFNIMVVIICQLVPEIESVLREVFGKFNFREESGLLQFWACHKDPFSEKIGCYLVLTDLTYNPTQDQGLEDYRKKCLEKQYPFIGIEKSVGNWLAGRATQTGIADHRTIHHVLDQEDQHSIDIGVRGQLVLPVFFGNELIGVIEYVTSGRQESYVEDFEQFQNLLKGGGCGEKIVDFVRQECIGVLRVFREAVIGGVEGSFIEAEERRLAMLKG
ncbi:hypothetical protein E3N88_30851 [Mikania micrantha]|uniref:Uncharacterized protein n=1 Tax=Mikania micrantha TaxID=192012 RepID=A0A5N6MQ09_9ASTR|nr:hypothetical protein E3N88_30851 [Mikania micrantha]